MIVIAFSRDIVQCVAASAYRYSVHKEKIIVMHGRVIRAGRDTIWFEPYDGHRRRATESEGEMLNGSVWLRENDLEKAKGILFEYLSEKYNHYTQKAMQCYNTMQKLLEQNN